MGCGPPKGGAALDPRLALLVHGAVMPFCGPGLGAEPLSRALGGPFSYYPGSGVRRDCWDPLALLGQ